VFVEYQPEHIRAQAAGREGTDQHVGVGEDLQEISRNTSSSVRNPAAAA
jgi:hypothetical protein